MAYSFALMTVIFIKRLPTAAGWSARYIGPEAVSEVADRRLDVRRLVFDGPAAKATRPRDTCVSTPSLCNANFARS